MLTIGINHIAVISKDLDRLQAFYREVFEAEVIMDGTEFPDGSGPRVSLIRVGPYAELNAFEIDVNTEADRQIPMFGRGRLDHFALQAGSIEDFEEIRRRLRDRGCADDFVTDFGHVLSLFFTDPDGLEGEVCVDNPDHQPGVFKPPGTRAERYPAKDVTADGQA